MSKHRHNEYEKSHHNTCSDARKPNFIIGLQIITVVLLVVLALQMTSLNSALKKFDSQIKAIGIQDLQKAKEDPGIKNDKPSAKPPSTTGVDMKALMDDDAVKGDPNAPVTIVEWSDFQCPFCGRFFRETLTQIEENYIKTGKVKLVYRDFPLSFHQYAQKAAEAAECAGEQGKFWEMHDKLFSEGVDGGVDTYKRYAQQIGLDAGEFNNCLDAGKMASEIAKDIKDGQANGIRGTPGFIINGKLVSGAQPYANFKAIIDAALRE
ncbi:MAG: DsbA family protein [Candidatus Micrarchaeota archaeon]|nr:DsbA family protein [Candidatus Micrarchaeota archaeon]